MFAVYMFVDEEWYIYGKYDDLKRANEVAMMVRDQRGVWVQVKEVA